MKKLSLSLLAIIAVACFLRSLTAAELAESISQHEWIYAALVVLGTRVFLAQHFD